MILVQNGQKVFLLAAYARGLYCQLTGEIMYPDIPIIIFDRSRKGHIANEHIFPNPFYDQLHVECQESGYIRIMDITGKAMMTQQIVPGKTIIETSTWTSGKYIVNVQNKDGSASLFKVVKQ